MLDRRAVTSVALLASLSAPAFAQACLTEAVNVTPTGAISTDDSWPANLWISPDGRWIAWVDQAADLVPGSVAGGSFRPYIRDRATGGDGTGAACPCGNSGAPGHGRASFTRPEGARVVALGDASVAHDTLILAGDSATNSIVTYFQGTGQAYGGAGVVFGDGLVCVNGTVIRLGTRSTWNGTSRFPGPGDASVSQRGQVPASGAVRHYQIWYRIAAPFCTPATFSFSNAISIAWTP